MDRLKYRVWDKRLNRYLGNEDPTQMLLENGNLAYLDDEGMKFYEVEFCTGLKDKNGKLIYEGDIVYSPLDGGTQKVIYWDNGLASFMAYNRYPDKHYTQRIGDGYFIELGFEVKGNIHENSDLLGADR